MVNFCCNYRLLNKAGKTISKSALNIFNSSDVTFVIRRPNHTVVLLKRLRIKRVTLRATQNTCALSLHTLRVPYHAVRQPFQLQESTHRSNCYRGIRSAYILGQLQYGNGIIQWTNCKLEWVYHDPVARNPRVNPSFRPLSRCRPSHSV